MEKGWYWVKIKPLSIAPGRAEKFSSFPEWTPAYWTGSYVWLEDEDYSLDDCSAFYPHRIPTPDEFHEPT